MTEQITFRAHPPSEGGFFNALKYPSSRGGWALCETLFSNIG